jgi:hypothetical protein
MKNSDESYLRWFIIGMGHVLGISHSMPKTQDSRTEMEAIGGDFRLVGDDLRNVMKRFPSNTETARTLGQPRQLELAGLS